MCSKLINDREKVIRTLGCAPGGGQATQGPNGGARWGVDRQHLPADRNDHCRTQTPARGIHDPPERRRVVIRASNPQVCQDVTDFLAAEERHTTDDNERQVGDFEQGGFNWAHLCMRAGQDGDFRGREPFAKSFLDIRDDQCGFPVRVVRGPEPDLIPNVVFGPETQSRRVVSGGALPRHGLRVSSRGSG